MSDSPIFRQLNTEFAAKGAAYEDLVKFSTPAFVWGIPPVVQLDKQSPFVSMTKNVRPEDMFAEEPVNVFVKQMVKDFCDTHPKATNVEILSTPEFDGTVTFTVRGKVKKQTLDFKKPEPLWAKVMPALVPAGTLEAYGVEPVALVDSVTGKDFSEPSEDNETMDFGQLIGDYIAQVGKSFAEAHPLAIITDTSVRRDDDGGMTMTIEAVQPITSVQPLSERNSATPME